MQAVEAFARVLLRRYGVVFRKLLDREALKVSWFELGRRSTGKWRRAAKFVAVILSVASAANNSRCRKQSAICVPCAKPRQSHDLVSLSGSDPLNLVGILTPGSRIPALWRNRILLRDGVPVAALEAGKVLNLDGDEDLRTFESALKVGKLPTALRKYYH